MDKIVVWLKPDGNFYHKKVRGYYATYEVGYINSYGHKIVHVIDNLPYKDFRIPFKVRLKRKLINYIEKM